MKQITFASAPRRSPLAYGALALVLAASLAACGGKKEQKSGQALASVNGEEITTSQLNEELQRSGVTAAQQQAASKQLLESLIDRQVLINEAVKDKTDRDPKVVQAIERAKALIISQAYLQKRLGAPQKPTKAEVQEYFDKHPELFSARKQFDMRQLNIATDDINDELKKVIDDAKSLDEVAAWMDAHQVKYTRTDVSRSTADLPAELGGKLLSMDKGQLFLVREGPRSVLSVITATKDAPVALAATTPQIEQYLANTRLKEAATAELKRLRAAAKVEYLNKAAGEPAPAAAAPAPAAGTPADPAAAATERGVAGLK